MSAIDRISIDRYVLDALMPDLVAHDRRPAAFLVYLCLWQRTRGGARSVVISLSMMSEATGLSKRSVQTALQHLERRALVSTRRASATSAPSVSLHLHWRK